MQVLWALDFNKANYKTINYTPFFGEGWLRRKTGKNDGLITVPVMFTPEGGQPPWNRSSSLPKPRGCLKNPGLLLDVAELDKEELWSTFVLFRYFDGLF